MASVSGATGSVQPVLLESARLANDSPTQGTTLARILARNTLASWANYAFATLITVILTPLVISSLGTPGYGAWILISQLTGYAGLLDLGVQPALAKHVAGFRAAGDKRSLREYLSTALAFYSAVAVVVIGMSFVASRLVKSVFNLDAVASSNVSGALFLLGCAAAIAFPATVFSATLKGHLRFDRLSLLNIAVQAVRASGVLVTVTYDLGFIGLACSGVAGSLVSLAGGAGLARVTAGSLGLSPRLATWGALRELTVFGFFCVWSLAGWYLCYATDGVVIGILLTPTDLAHFGLAANVLVVASGMIGAFSQSFLPLASEYQAASIEAKTGDAYVLGTRIALYLSLPALIVLMISAPELLSLWVGQDFGHPAGRLLQVLAIAYLPVMANSPGFQIALGTGLHRWAALLSLGEGVLNLTLSIVLAQRIGVVGVAFGTLFGSLLVQGVLWPRLLCMKLHVRLAALWTGALRPVLRPLLPMVALYLVWWSIGVPSRGFALLLGPGVFLGGYWLLGMRSCLSQEATAR